jgi:pimeloyl-ACP methyl ester carboxylesterase
LYRRSSWCPGWRSPTIYYPPWPRSAHGPRLLELPGFEGGTTGRRRLTVAQFGQAVGDWIVSRQIGRVVLVGHSSGTQVAVEAAADQPRVAGVVLASPMIDPALRPIPRLAAGWLRDGRREAAGLMSSQYPEWRRAGLRRLAHLVRIHRGYVLDGHVERLTVPLLIIRGRNDTLSTTRWARHLANCALAGQYLELPGAHTFPWRDPYAWSEPVQTFTGRLP